MAKVSFPLFITRRYLLAKKSHSAIHIISLLSVLGVAVGTMALVIVLSVFNGFDVVIKSLFNAFDPELKITLVEGKVFVPDSSKIFTIKSIQGVDAIAETLEENALFQYRDKQHIAIIKGVSDNFLNINEIPQRITSGKCQIQSGSIPYALIGQGVSYYLGVNVGLSEPIVIYVPRRGAEVSMVPEEAFNKKYIIPAGVFSIEQDIDTKYMLVPIEFARQALEYEKEVTALEIKLKPNVNVDEVKTQIQTILGSNFSVKDRYQQQELFYKIMKSEKWAIFFILLFILIVASLNIIGSLTMLILDKKKDIRTLSHLGADWKSIRKIFLFNGWLNTIIGALLGTGLGLLVCFLQIKYGFVRLEGSGSFIIDAYPVKILLSDILLVFFTVLGIGFATSWIPVRVISKKYFS